MVRSRIFTTYYLAAALLVSVSFPSKWLIVPNLETLSKKRNNCQRLKAKSKRILSSLQQQQPNSSHNEQLRNGNEHPHWTRIQTSSKFSTTRNASSRGFMRSGGQLYLTAMHWARVSPSRSRGRVRWRHPSHRISKRPKVLHIASLRCVGWLAGWLVCTGRKPQNYGLRESPDWKV